MTIIESKFSSGQLGTVTGDCAGDVVVNDYFIDVTAAQIEADNIFDLGILPAYHTVVDAILIPGDLDTNASPALTLDVGIMSGTPGDTETARTCGAELFSASTAAQGGTATRASAATAFKIKATEADRSIGVKVVTDAATAAAGRIRVRVLMAPSDHNVQF
jgi:hypothetical protein